MSWSGIISISWENVESVHDSYHGVYHAIHNVELGKNRTDVRLIQELWLDHSLMNSDSESVKERTLCRIDGVELWNSVVSMANSIELKVSQQEKWCDMCSERTYTVICNIPGKVSSLKKTKKINQYVMIYEWLLCQILCGLFDKRHRALICQG